jgi:formylglycine-generating enzyme required for sulfatase activity
MEFVRIAAGSFLMGCSPGDSYCEENEKPVHRVTISKAFELGTYLVTQEQYQAVMGTNPSQFKGDNNLPVDSVTWNDAQEFINRLNGRQDRHHYRLPTEAEWEYAARAGTTGATYGPLDSIAWYGNNSGRSALDADAILRTYQSDYTKRLRDNGNQPHPVGQKRANAWGLYDMLGNLWEWVQDKFEPYTTNTVRDPTGAASGNTYLRRGGSWGVLFKAARVSLRYVSDPTSRDLATGFRIVREAIPR